jgi:undecaprenyl-phosphate 4-deoxy-4-formamido-L-arabinose transferase
MISKENKLFVSIVIPVYNSANTIDSLTNELIESLSTDYQLEIVLVNDDSKDNSEQVCINLFEKYKPFVKFYSLAKNVGEHNAVMAGLNYASGDYIVIMDDDFQNPISEVVKLVSYASRKPYDVVYTYYEDKRHSYLRNTGSWFNDKVANILLKKPKDLYLSSFKVLNRFIVNEIISYDLPFPYIDGLILRSTSKVGKIKVEHQKRESGKSGYTLYKLISLWSNMFTNFSILPLRVAVIIGFIFAGIGFLLGGITVFEKLQNPDLLVGYASLFVVISIFAGIQLIAIGMVGEYLGRMFLSQNKRPQYTVRKKFEI